MTGVNARPFSRPHLQPYAICAYSLDRFEGMREETSDRHHVSAQSSAEMYKQAGTSGRSAGYSGSTSPRSAIEAALCAGQRQRQRRKSEWRRLCDIDIEFARLASFYRVRMSERQGTACAAAIQVAEAGRGTRGRRISSSAEQAAER